jgi:hypothetical protein
MSALKQMFVEVLNNHIAEVKQMNTAANKEQNVTPRFAVVRVFAGGYKAISKHDALKDAAQAVKQNRLNSCATIIRDGLTGERITQGRALEAA